MANECQVSTLILPIYYLILQSSVSKHWRNSGEQDKEPCSQGACDPVLTLGQQAPVHSWQQRVVKRSIQLCGEGAVEALVHSDRGCQDADKVVFELGLED